MAKLSRIEPLPTLIAVMAITNLVVILQTICGL